MGKYKIDRPVDNLFFRSQAFLIGRKLSPLSIASILSSIELTHVWCKVAFCRTHASCVKALLVFPSHDYQWKKINRKKRIKQIPIKKKDVIDVIVIGSVIVKSMNFKFLIKTHDAS
jgi:hypothetical protein